jgi:hypothetical protein
MAKMSLGETLKSLEVAVQESKLAHTISEPENPHSGAESPIREAAAPAKSGVARALFTTGVRQYEPVNALTELKRRRKTLFFYTELLGMENRQLKHRWYFDGKEVSVTSIVPQAPRWRVVSHVQLEDRYGRWAAELVNDSDELLVRREILYQTEAAILQ